MSLDSILENPSLKNMILNNAVREYEGYLTGFSSNNFLETFAPEAVLAEIKKVEADRPADVVAKTEADHAENEAAKTITSKILNSTLGSFYLKDILSEGNIIDQNIVNQSSPEIVRQEILYNKYRETFVVLTEGTEQAKIKPPTAPSMESVLLRRHDSIYGGYTVGEGHNYYTQPNEAGLLYANMGAMTMEFEKKPYKDLIQPIYKVETTTKGTGEYILKPEAAARIQQEAKYVDPDLQETIPDDYVEKRIKVKTKKVVGQKTIKRYKYNSTKRIVNQSYGEPSKENANLVAIVIKNPKYSIPTRNQNYLSVFFNAISQIDMSLATPYLELTFFNIIPKPEPGGKGENKLNQVAFMRFDNDNNLMKISRFTIRPSTSNIDGKQILTTQYAKQHPSDAASQRHMTPDDEAEVSFQNIFQSPQTLNNGNINRAENLFGGSYSAGEGSEFVYDSAKIVLDPFAPMLTLNNFDVTVSEGGYYAVSSRRASMKLTLHDRSRLVDITPFVTPGALQKTSVKVTYGWSHPLANPHSYRERNNTIANFIDSMRETAYYRLSSSDIRLEGSKVDINVKMDFMGGREFRKIPATTGVKKEIDEIKQTFNAAIKLISESFTREEGKVHQNYRVIEKAIDSFEDLVDSEKHKEFYKAVKDASDAYHKSNPHTIKDETKLDLFKKMLVLIDLYNDEEIANINDIKLLVEKIEADDLSEKKIGVSIRQSRASREIFYKRLQGLTERHNQVLLSEPANQEKKEEEKVVEKTVTGTRLTPDYFTTLSSMHYLFEKKFIKDFDSINAHSFYPTSKEFPRGFISLGKLIQNLVAYPMNQTYLYNEIQVIYYPVNAEAAGARKYTTASLPISIDRLYEEIDKHMKEGTFMTPDSVFKILSNMFQNRNAACYQLFNKNRELEKTLETEYGYKNKDGKISLNEKGQKAAYAKLQENFIEKKKASYPTLEEITGKKKSANTSSTAPSSSSGQSASSVAAQKAASRPSDKEVPPDPRNYEQPMYEAWIESFKQDGIKETIKKIYEFDGIGGPADITSFKMIHLKMDVEPCQVLHGDNGRSEKIRELTSLTDINAPYVSNASILRLHIYDAQLSPRNGLSFVSEHITNGSAYLRGPSVYDPQLNAQAELNFSDNQEENNSKVPRKKNRKVLKLNAAGRMIVNMPPWLLKKYLKREYPSITYGASSAVVKSINLSSTTENEIAYGKAVQSWQDQEEGVYSKYIIQQKMDLNIIPSTIDLQLMGCPFLKVCGHVYVDAGTNTDMDNVYSVVSFTHSISPGNFVTSVKLALPFAASTSNLRSSLAESLTTLGKFEFEEVEKD